MSNQYELKETLDEVFGTYSIDHEFEKKLTKFVLNWENKSEDYREFINSPLIGVHTIAFSTRDEDILFSDILRVDKDTLQSKIYRCDGINKNFLISSNVVNVTLVYFMHKVLLINDKHKYDEMLYLLYKIFFFKQIGSMYYNFFKYPLNRDSAVSVFEDLSDRFLIKRLGSWEKVMLYQADLMVVSDKELSNKGNVSNKLKLKDFKTQDVVTAINDMNGRIKDMICKLAEVIYSVIEDKNSTLKTVSSVTDLGDGEIGLTNLTGSEHSHVQYLYSIINSKNDFVKTIGVNLVVQILKKVERSKFLRVLEHLTEVDIIRGSDEDYVAKTMSVSIEYLNRNGIRGDYLRSLGKCLKLLNGYFRTATVKNEDLLQAKAVIKDHVQNALGITRRSVIATMTMGVMLYLFVRAISRNSI